MVSLFCPRWFHNPPFRSAGTVMGVPGVFTPPFQIGRDNGHFPQFTRTPKPWPTHVRSASSGHPRFPKILVIRAGNHGFVPPLWNAPGPIPPLWNASGPVSPQWNAPGPVPPLWNGPGPVPPLWNEPGPVPPTVERTRACSTSMERTRACSTPVERDRVRSGLVERSPCFRT